MLIAAFAWTIAGGMLLFRGLGYLESAAHRYWLDLFLSVIAGLVFYLTVFSRISIRHVTRIMKLPHEFPCAFSFFNLKAYVIMIIMIGSGIFLRKSGLLPILDMALIYIAMGTPLFLSSIRFYFFTINYHSKFDNYREVH